MVGLDTLREVSAEAWRQADLAVRTGLRAEEFRALTWAWVESAPGGAGVRVLLRSPAWAAKTRRDRVVGLTAETLARLNEARASRDTWQGPLLSGDFRKSDRLARQAIGYSPKITLRDLRHCHATGSAQGTGDAAATQAALGHTDLRTTQRYLSSTIARTASAAVAVGEALRASKGPNCHDGLSRSRLGMPRNSDPAGPRMAAGSTFSNGRPLLDAHRAFWVGADTGAVGELIDKVNAVEGSGVSLRSV